MIGIPLGLITLWMFYGPTRQEQIAARKARSDNTTQVYATVKAVAGLIAAVVTVAGFILFVVAS